MLLKDFSETFSKDFRDPEFIPLYLDEGIKYDFATFLLGLRDVLDANCGVSNDSSRAALNYQNLYKTLSKDGLPEFEALQAALASVGMRFAIAPAEPPAEMAKAA